MSGWTTHDKHMGQVCVIGQAWLELNWVESSHVTTMLHSCQLNLCQVMQRQSFAVNWVRPSHICVRHNCFSLNTGSCDHEIHVWLNAAIQPLHRITGAFIGWFALSSLYQCNARCTTLTWWLLWQNLDSMLLSWVPFEIHFCWPVILHMVNAISVQL